MTILATSDASSGVARRGDELCVALGRTCAGSCAEFDGTLVEVVSLAPFKGEWRLKGVVFDGTLVEVVSLAPFKGEWRLKGVVLVRSY